MRLTLKTNIADTIGHVGKYRDQVPYATSRALNATVFQLKSRNAPDSMRHDMQQPVSYTLNSARYRKSSKTNLEASVYIDQSRLGYLQHPAVGNPRTPQNFPYVMVPVGLERVGRGRVISPRLAQSYRTTLLSRPDCFEGAIRGTQGIWQRIGENKRGGQGRGLKLLVVYLSHTNYRATWRLYMALRNAAPAILRTEYEKAWADAIATAH